MAGPTLLTHAGMSENDMTPGTIRTPISDTVLAALYLQPGFISSIQLSPFLSGGGTGLGNSVMQLIHTWPETRLNPRTVTLIDAAGITSTSTSFTVTAADANNLDLNMFLYDQSQAYTAAELIQVTGIQVTGANATVFINRGVYGTTPVSHATGSVFQINAAPVTQGSNFGRDMSRSPVIKQNLIYTMRRDVQVAASLQELSQFNMIPGFPNFLADSLHDRVLEMLQDLNRTFLFSVGTPSNVQTETPTPWGLLPFLGYGPVNFNTTTALFNANGAALNEQVLNAIFLNLILQGAEIPDALLAHPSTIIAISRIFKDQIRLAQAEDWRGQMVQRIQPAISTQQVSLIMDPFVPGPAPGSNQLGQNAPILAALDLDRIALVPFLRQFFYLLESPTYYDGETVSAIMKCTLELRNTGTDMGQAHQIAYNFVV